HKIRHILSFVNRQWFTTMAYRAPSDRMLFILTSLLTIFGLVMVYSASSVVASSRHGLSYYYFLRQLVYAAAGYALMLALMNRDYHFWQQDKVVGLLLILSAGSLLLVFTQPRINAAHRWLRYGSFISFQPSEIAKLVFLVFMAAFLHKYGDEINQPVKRLLPCLLVLGLFGGLIAAEPDLGQAVTLALIVIVILFVAGISWKSLAGMALLSAPAVCLAIVSMPYRGERIKAFLNPFHDPLGTGWQISQSLTAVGSGGPWGLGLGASRQKLFFLPEAHSDFIFAVIGEELGLMGAGFVALAFLLFFYRGIKIALRAPDRFGFYLGLGITLMVAIQAFINISMVLAMIPTKGIALPFISQGGSSLLLNLVATGLLLNIAHYAEEP
ncbi:MAG: putative lipid II flippase FtsW, partial [Acidobacteria bacterium]